MPATVSPSRQRAFPGRVVFDHLPKTGGSAVTAWLTGALGAGCVSPHLDGEHAPMIRQSGGQYSVLCGHVSFCQGEGLDPRYQYITLFRDPLDRLVSWLYFVATNHADDELMGLVPLVRRFIDSDGADLPERLRPHVSNNYVEHFCRVLGDGREGEQQRLANAIATVASYDVVGLHEAMPRFLVDVARLLDMPAPAAIARTNETRSRPAVAGLGAGLRARLLQLNQLDIALYDAVRAMQRPQAALAAVSTGWQAFTRATVRSVRDDALQLAPPTLREGADVFYGGALNFDLDITLTRTVPRLLAGIHLFDGDQRLAYGINSGMLDQLHDGLAAGRHHLTFTLEAALPAGRYTAGFAFVELLADGERELAWHDALCSFEVHPVPGRTAIGYADLAASLAVESDADAILTEARGSLRLASSLLSLRGGETVSVDVEVSNDSPHDWRSGRRLPVMLAYHWLTSDGEVLVYDGIRSPLPTQGLAAGAHARCRMQVQAPDHDGPLVLVLTALQEHVGWFETLGFRPDHVDVKVGEASALAVDGGQRWPGLQLLARPASGHHADAA